MVSEALDLDGPFLLSELSVSDDMIEDVLEGSGLFFWTFDNDGSRRFISKKDFFEGSEFSIHLSKEEIAGAYLVAAGRFLPFTDQTPPLSINGKDIKLIKKCIPCGCLEKVLSLDSGRSLIQTLSEQTGRNIYSLDVFESQEIAVYDLSPLRAELKNGIHIQLKIFNGSLEGNLSHVEDIELDRLQRWCELMEKSFIGVLKEFGTFTEISEQLELAYFYGSSQLREAPALALRDFLSLSKKLKVYDFIFRRVVWFCDQSPLDSLFAREKALEVRKSLQKKVTVNGAFYSLVPEQSKNMFLAESLVDFPENDLMKNLKTSVLKSVLWISNSQSHLDSDALPVEELLLFDAVFADLQNLCEIYRKLPVDKTSLDDFSGAVDLNSTMLGEVCELLQIYYLSDL